MKRFSIYFIAISLLIYSCNSNSDILPSEVWSGGCASLNPYKNGYKLSGMCCEYLIIPKLKFKENNSFLAKSSHYTYTGAGYQDVEVNLRGKLSENQDTLTLQYESAGKTISYVLTPGPAKVACMCGCD